MNGWMPQPRRSLSPEESVEPPWDTPAGRSRAQASLSDAIEADIIPRLLSLHRAVPWREPSLLGGYAPPPIEPSEIEFFTELVLRGLEPARARIRELVARGVTLEVLCLELLTPSARLLGVFWSEDRCGFAEVTIAVGHMQTLLRDLSATLRLPHDPDCVGRHAVFAAVSGEQHTLGLTMVCDFFRTSGWTVWGEAPTRAEALVEAVGQRSFDIAGFSISTNREVVRLAELIRAVRYRSLNRQLQILVGGPILLERPQIATLVGADGTAGDARQAMLLAAKLVSQRDAAR